MSIASKSFIHSSSSWASVLATTDISPRVGYKQARLMTSNVKSRCPLTCTPCIWHYLHVIRSLFLCSRPTCRQQRSPVLTPSIRFPPKLCLVLVPLPFLYVSSFAYSPPSSYPPPIFSRNLAIGGPGERCKLAQRDPVAGRAGRSPAANASRPICVYVYI